MAKHGYNTRVSWRRSIGVGTVALTLAACGGGGSGGDEEATSEGAFYEDKTIDLVVPYDAGGGYDVFARTLAPYLGDCLGAQIVVRNEPGAGSLLATNATANAAPDDLRVQIVNVGGTAAAQIAEAQGVQFDLSELSWIGRLANAPDVVTVAPDGDFATFEDILDASDTVRFVTTGPGSQESIAASVLAAAYGFPLELVSGFAGSGEARNAVIAGNADAHALVVDSSLAAIESGEVAPLVVVDDEPAELLPDVPAVSTFEAPDAEGDALVESLIRLEQLGRALAAPPGLPEEQLTELREAFACAVEDEELLGEYETQQRPVNILSGEEFVELLDEVLDPSPEFEAAIKESF
jgi:tripartite-type tricarboxylate transporter receptor subunit TctC